MADPYISVSVVIPCYRAVGTIQRAIASIWIQTSPALEVIVVDDASGDGSVAIALSVATHYPKGWVKIEQLPKNGGVASARNHGWDMAQGEFVAFLDADDSWHPRKLELQMNFMRLHPEFALSGHDHVGLGRQARKITGSPGWRELYLGGLLWRNPFVTPSVVLRRDLPLRFRDQQRHMEDHLLWIEVAAAGHRIARLESRLAVIHSPHFGISGLSSDLKLMERAELWNFCFLRERGVIGPICHLTLQAWSICRFIRRLFVISIRRAAN